MQYDEFQTSRKFIEGKLLELMAHEKKGYARVGFPAVNYTEYSMYGRTFYSVKNNSFKYIIEEGLLTAREMFPANFGKENAINILHAIHKSNQHYKNLKNEIDFLKTENFAIIVENINGQMDEKILRLDLFRMLKPIRHKKRKYEFVGGVLHALKHFSYRDIPLSTGNEINNLYAPTQIIEYLVKAFFINVGKFEKPDTYVSSMEYTETLDLKCVFYYEANTRVYFLKSIYPENKKKRNKKIFYFSGNARLDLWQILRSSNTISQRIIILRPVR